MTFLGIVQVAQVICALPCKEGTIYLHQIWGDAFDALLKVYKFYLSGQLIISVSDQLIIVKLYVITGSAKELIASILLHAESFVRQVIF